MMPPSSWTQFHARLHQTLRSRSLLPKHQQVLVAVSGGQDSLCLMQLLLDLQPKWHWNLAVAHCNHGWRADSRANAEYIEQLAQRWQLPYYCATAINLASTEAAAREWRYQALTEIAQAHGYVHVVTGHTASDRTETLLYNLLRGSGAEGLQALAWRRELAVGIVLVRPLLEFTRLETAQFCQKANLTIWQDSTNDDRHYARNRIRQELIPYLQTHFNPQVEHTLAQTAELLRSDVEYLEQMTSALWQQAVVYPSKGDILAQIKLNRPILKTAPLALQRRVMRQVLQTLLSIAPNFNQVEKLVSLIHAPNRSQTDPFPGGTIARVEGEWILLEQPKQVINPSNDGTA